MAVCMNLYPVSEGIGAMYHGNCAYVEQLNTLLHLFINLLSTLLLGASNFGMQILVAPTRQDLDTAHKKGKSMAIGIQAFGNLRHLGKATNILWIMLAIGSGGLHLT